MRTRRTRSSTGRRSLKPEFAPRQGQRDLPPALETRMTIFCEIRSVLNPSMPLTTGTFNLLSKTKSGHRTKRAVSVERASPEGRSRVLETCQLFWPNPSNIPRCSADCQPSSRSELFTFSALLQPGCRGRAARDMHLPRTLPAGCYTRWAASAMRTRRVERVLTS
jgi:hypothetical protein